MRRLTTLTYPLPVFKRDIFIDSLFNKNGEGCRIFYEEYRKSYVDTTKPSPTRNNIEMVASKLKKVGVYSILETNVICYGAKDPDDLRLPEHYGGKARGREIFRATVTEIRPKAIAIHGTGVCDVFSRSFRLRPRPKPPKTKDDFIQIELDSRTQLFVIPSLALPGFQNWPYRPFRSFCHWADEYLEEISERVRQVVESGV